MKRFFKPVGDAPAAKRAKGDEGAGGGSGGRGEGGGRAPRRLATWNANGLGARARSAADCAALEAFVRDFEPDVLAVQEVWMRRDGSAAGRLASADARDRADGDAWRSLLRRPALRGYACYYALADKRKAGSLALVREECRPDAVRRALRDGDPAEQEGRVLVLRWREREGEPALELLCTYSQNSGWGDAGREKRRAWDAQVGDFLDARAREVPAAPPLIWCGDLNCAVTDADVSDPTFFASQTGGRGAEVAADPRDRGQPGFIPNERARFEDLLRRGGLSCAYRHVHGPCARHASWMGHEGVHMVGRYRGKWMRLDYFLLQEQLLRRVRADGTGILSQRFAEAELVQRDTRCFLGSDHCPVTLVLEAAGGGERAPEPPAANAATADYDDDDYATDDYDGAGALDDDGAADRPWH